MKIKICGITNEEDAIKAIDAGVDSLGFVFYKLSKKYIFPEEAEKIIKKLPPFIKTIGVFADMEKEEIEDIVKRSKVDMAQIYFEPQKDFLKQLKIKTIKVVRVQNKKDLDKYKDDYKIVDSYIPEYGGKGVKVDLSLFNGVDCSKIIIAGGIEVSDIQKIKKLGFYGIDVSSSVENLPGKKNIQKIKDLVRENKK